MGMDGAEFRFRTLSEGVESVVRRMILMGELVPGERINEVQLAEQLEVSRGPVREALRTLQSQGLVVYHAHRGHFVSELNDEDAEEVYKLRALLEVGAVKMALPRVTPEVLQQLETTVQNFESARTSGDLRELIQADLDFHHTIVKLSGNSRLFEMYKSLDTQLGAMFIAVQSKAPERIGKLREMHQELIDALKSGDEEQVADAFAQHYLSAWRALQSMSGAESR
ncbi:GntR family transcriptional regulator [Alicyclobacillus fastidiosus]|uniref:GntR family transcriptional regulator n=1 Tax=Alicyclobacillus fastidiosus TaxID=392011 RepID=A0ABV5A922_9BACL|nr:GntR family transcriptional regulator [Alicyclobacillus fastidiosus]WEH10726.1 GntR family transcriptional regulator [Alicyclobacillus fastidiosus]